MIANPAGTSVNALAVLAHHILDTLVSPGMTREKQSQEDLQDQGNDSSRSYSHVLHVHVCNIFKP